MCAGVHGYVFVVDAERLAAERRAPVDSAEEAPHTFRALAELQQLLNPGWAPRAAPLLVLACHHAKAGDAADAPHLSCVDVAERLRLPLVAPRSWRVQCLDVSSIAEPLTQGLQWLTVRSSGGAGAAGRA